MKKVSPQTIHVLNAVLFMVQQEGPVSFQDIANHTGLTKRTICTYTKRVLTISLTRFRKKYRIKLAALIIESSSKNTKLSQINPMVGIKNPIVFARYFKQEFGISPRTYQKRFGGTKSLPVKGSLSDQVLKTLIQEHCQA